MTALTFAAFVLGILVAAVAFGVFLALATRGRPALRPSERLDGMHKAIYGMTRAETERRRVELRRTW